MSNKNIFIGKEYTSVIVDNDSIAFSISIPNDVICIVATKIKDNDIKEEHIKF